MTWDQREILIFWGRIICFGGYTKEEIPNYTLVLSGVLRSRDVSRWLIGALNDIIRCVAKALFLTFVDPNTWIEEGNFARDWLLLIGRRKKQLGQPYARVSGPDFGGSAGSKMWQILENGNYKTREYRETGRSSIEEEKTLLEDDRPVTSILKRSEVEVVSRFKYLSGAPAYRKESQ